MAANVYKRMVYSYLAPMWHAITEPSQKKMTAEEILLEKFQGGFPVDMRPITVTLNGVQVETGDFAIVRGTSPSEFKEVVFGYATNRFHPLQPRDIAQSFDMNVCQPAETMAFLGEGQEMFISWVMPKFEVLGDEIEMYGIVRCGFDTLKGAKLFTSTYRPVCQNTINLAEGWAKRNSDGNGKGEIWKGKAVNKNLLRDLGYWMSHVQGKALLQADLLQAFFGKLAETPITSDNEAQGILLDAFPPMQSVSEFYPSQLRGAKEEKTVDYNEGQSEIRDGIFGLFAGAGTAITPDYWGMLNSTSEYFCHVQPSKRPIAESVMFGGRQKNIMKVVTTLSDRVR
jgi:hypothetical protein